MDELLNNSPWAFAFLMAVREVMNYLRERDRKRVDDLEKRLDDVRSDLERLRDGSEEQQQQAKRERPASEGGGA